MLHKNTTHKKLKDICNQTNKKEILTLLLISSKFEEKLKNSLEKLILTKQDRWDQDKRKCCKRMEELSNYFSGGQSFGDVQADEGYKVWFYEMKVQID